MPVIEVRPVDKSHYPEYFGWDLWLYDLDDFEVLQLVFPTTSGIWPWEGAASVGFRNWQPLLSVPEAEG